MLNGINYAAVYDFAFYRDRYADVRAAFGNDDVATLRHFVNHGMREGRVAHPNFNVHVYRQNYADLRVAFGNDLVRYFMHFINQGMREGRNATDVFVDETTIGTPDTGTVRNPITVLNGVDYSAVYDFEFYRNRYPDLLAAFGNDDVAMLRHFVNHGMREGRIAHPNFNVHVYRSMNPELQRTFGAYLHLYYLHAMGLFDNAFRHPMVATARTQIGNVGGEPYWRWWGWNVRVPWCAIFVSWVADRNGFIQNGSFPRFQSIAVGRQWFGARGQLQSRNHRANPGDLIFFDWNGNGVWDHVGIVVTVIGNTVHVIEGNAADAVRWRSYNINSSVISGYATPAYR